MNDEILQQINSPEDLKKLTLRELRQCAFETRALITQSVLKNGGHLASSLGAVEIALALHYVFSAPRDIILFDVGHQAYAHKIVTGRREAFSCLRSDGGASGFLKPSESEYDAFVSGHSSTSLSAALGFARARDLGGGGRRIVAVIGDGALTGGMAFEALNDIGAAQTDMTIILNDNDMSISKNVGAMSRYFSRLRISKGYLRLKSNIKKAVSAMPFFGDRLVGLIEKSKGLFRAVFRTNKMFEQMGIRYYGPYDGNNLESLVTVLKQAKDFKGPVLIHLLTKKGSGFKDAEENPSFYHGLNPAGTENGNLFGAVAGETLCALAEEDEKICAITAAMADGTGLKCFSDRFPRRYYDVGIAEQHAVTMAAGLAAGGLKPYFCVYSSFLQRGYDQILHDVAIQGLPVRFLIDRGGVAGSDGVTHQGVFDLSYLSMIPGLTILTPKDGNELREMIRFSAGFNKPLAIRYPKTFGKDYGSCPPMQPGKWEILRSGKSGKVPVFILAAGSRMLGIAEQTVGAAIVNARSVKPLDTEFLDAAGKSGAMLVTMEDGVRSGGFGARVLDYMNENSYLLNGARVTVLGFKDEFIHTHSVEKAFAGHDMTKEHLQKIIDSQKR